MLRIEEVEGRGEVGLWGRGGRGAGPPHTLKPLPPRRDVRLLCCVFVSGGGRDLDGEPGAVLQTILRVHVQHPVIDPAPNTPPPTPHTLIQPDASCHTANKRQALISLTSFFDPPRLYPTSHPFNIGLGQAPPPSRQPPGPTPVPVFPPSPPTARISLEGRTN